MDNDILINQARQLYATLLSKQIEPLVNNQVEGLNRLDRLTIWAYGRYQRRLNRCAVCYQDRNYDCIREPGEKLVQCKPRFARAESSHMPIPVHVTESADVHPVHLHRAVAK